MVFLLATVLSATPGFISAASDIISVICKKKEVDELTESPDIRETFDLAAVFFVPVSQFRQKFV